MFGGGGGMGQEEVGPRWVLEERAGVGTEFGAEQEVEHPPTQYKVGTFASSYIDPILVFYAVVRNWLKS